MDRQFCLRRRLSSCGAKIIQRLEINRFLLNRWDYMNSASQNLIERAEAGSKLSRAEAEAFMEELLSGRVATPEIVRMLLALNQRAASVDELSGFARIIRRHAAPVFAQDEPRPTGLVDTCGTGGDETGTFNISTASA